MSFPEAIPASKKASKAKTSKTPVSPTGSASSQEELQALRLRNKVLTEALEGIKATADQHVQKHLDLVWFARNRTRHPNHKERKRIEKQHSDELSKLHTADGDYFHGMNSGCLAAARLFQQQADILHINEHTEVSPELLSEAARHKKKMEHAKESFPHVEVDGML